MTQLRNSFERKIDSQLEKSGATYSYETVKLPYIIYGTYLPDFAVRTVCGNQFILECKGHFRPEDKRKLAAVKAQHPEIDLRLLFYSFKLKDIRWAIKNRIPYAIGNLPQEWIGDASNRESFNETPAKARLSRKRRSKKRLVGLRKPKEQVQMKTKHPQDRRERMQLEKLHRSKHTKTVKKDFADEETRDELNRAKAFGQEDF